MKKLVAIILCTAIATGTWPGPRSALAADKAACLASYDATQKLKKSGKLVAARKEALVCAQDGCPTSVRDDCAAWAVELEKSIPTLVFAIVDSEGKDVTDAAVYIDGSKATIDGKAIAVDPGVHKVRVERDGVATLEQDVVANEGTKGKVVSFKFAKPEGVKKDGGPEPVKDTPEPAKSTSDAAPTPTATWVLVGLGTVGLIGFVGFGLSGSSKKQALEDANCKPACAQSDVDAAKQGFLLADVSLGVSLLSFGVAIVLYATRGSAAGPSAAAEKKASAWTLDLGARRGGGVAALSVAF